MRCNGKPCSIMMFTSMHCVHLYLRRTLMNQVDVSVVGKMQNDQG